MIADSGLLFGATLCGASNGVANAPQFQQPEIAALRDVDQRVSSQIVRNVSVSTQ